MKKIRRNNKLGTKRIEFQWYDVKVYQCNFWKFNYRGVNILKDIMWFEKWDYIENEWLVEIFLDQNFFPFNFILARVAP